MSLRHSIGDGSGANALDEAESEMEESAAFSCDGSGSGIDRALAVLFDVADRADHPEVTPTSTAASSGIHGRRILHIPGYPRYT